VNANEASTLEEVGDLSVMMGNMTMNVPISKE
jgi:hypothetical protein